MATDVKTANTLKGGEWLIKESIPSKHLPRKISMKNKRW